MKTNYPDPKDASIFIVGIRSGICVTLAEASGRVPGAGLEPALYSSGQSASEASVRAINTVAAREAAQ